MLQGSKSVLNYTLLQLGGPYIPLRTGRRDGRRSRADVVEQYLPDHNDTISAVLEKFAAMGIDTPGVVALLAIHPSKTHYAHSHKKIDMYPHTHIHEA